MSISFVDFLNKVKEENLSREQLEDYHDQMSALFAQFQIEISELEKKEAMFMGKKEERESVAQRKITWKATPEGQRLIECKRYSLAVKEMISSLKSRTFRLIN